MMYNRCMNKELMQAGFKLSFGEEVGNAVSHGVMAVLFLFGLPFTTLYATFRYGIWGGFGVSIYMICMFLMFLVSCLYHSMHYGSNQKYIFRKLDHMMILLAIAGSYTPICIVDIHWPLGLVVIAIEWIAVVVGIILKSVWKKTHMAVSLTIYLIMGWLAILMLPDLLKLDPLFLILIVLGGILYTIGVLFYRHPEKPYFHFIWHLFIIFAAISHFIAIVFLM